MKDQCPTTTAGLARRFLRFTPLIPALLLVGQAAGASQEWLQASPQYESEASKLRDAKSQDYSFTRAQLKDVLRFLAEDAGISFMALPESDGDKDKLITFKINSSPFTALETVANTYCVALILDAGIWHMRPLDDKQLIGRTYHIKYNSQEQVNTVESQNSFGPISREGGVVGQTGGIEGGSGGAAFMGGAGSASAQSSNQNIDLQGGPVSHLAANADELVKHVSDIVGLPTNGFDANISKGELDVDSFGRDSMKTPLRVYATSSEAKTEKEGGDEKSKPAVFWNSDSNNLFVVCTRQQHQLIEKYLQSIDKPQPLVAIEVKFFETTKDPRKQFGVDWSGALDGGLPINFTEGAASFVKAMDGTGNADALWQQYQSKPEGFGYFQSFHPNQYANITPQGAVLSTKAAQLKVKMLLADRETTSASYPRVLTKNNREVVIRNVVNKPVLASSSATSPGLGGTSTQTIQYLPIGTTLNILPKRLSDGTIDMSVSLMLSNVIGSEIIGGNAYPVASTRQYTAPLKVENGYTVAIAGLDEAFDSTEGTGVPFLSQIPLVGHLFKNSQRERTKKTLLMFITPTLLDYDDEGVSETPQSTLPRTKKDPPRDAPHFYSDGSLEGGPDKIEDAVLWCDYQERYLRRLIAENRGTDETQKDISLLRRACKAIEIYIQATKGAHPSESERLDLMAAKTTKVSERAGSLRCENWKESSPEFLYKNWKP